MKKVALILVPIIILLFGFMWYTGLFAKINIEEKEAGGHIIAGLHKTGPFSQIGPTLEEVSYMTKEIDVDSDQGFGIYYDDPNETPQEDLRWYVGIVLQEDHLSKIGELKSAGLTVDTIVKSFSLVAEMPTRTALAYMTHPNRVYPKLMEYQQNTPYLMTGTYEFYDGPAKKTRYVLQLDK